MSLPKNIRTSKLTGRQCVLLLEHPEEIVCIGHRLDIRVWLQNKVISKGTINILISAKSVNFLTGTTRRLIIWEKGLIKNLKIAHLATALKTCLKGILIRDPNYNNTGRNKSPFHPVSLTKTSLHAQIIAARHPFRP
jgi:hypothetical protein